MFRQPSLLFPLTAGVSDPSLDVHPSSGTLLLASGLSQVDLSLEILDDSDPELEETFTLILSQPTGGATLDPLAATSTFIIRYALHSLTLGVRV